MLSVIQLRERASEEAEAARALKETADEESRGLTSEEAHQFDKHITECVRLEQEANRTEQLEKVEERLQAPAERKVTPETANGERITAVATNSFRYGELKAFKGPNAEADAHRAGKFLMATIYGSASARQYCHDHGIELRIQSEGVNTAGGFLVPTEMERAIIDLREVYGMFRVNTRIHPMSTDHTTIPRRTGGVTAHFIGETTAITESEKSWNQVELTAKKLGALTRMSSDLSEDAIINVADDLANEMAYAFAKKEDECGLDGDGTSTYGGMVGIRTKFVDGNHTAGIYEGTSPFTAWANGTLADEVINIMALLPAYAWPRAKWYINPAGKVGLFDAISLAAGGNTTKEIAEGAKPMFAGYPVVVSAAMPAVPVNGEIAVLFGDLTMSSTLGDRRGITLKVSDQRYIEFDQIAVQATERFTIVNHDIGDTSVAGPVVALQGNT